MDEKKTEITTKNWILSIAGILILTLVIVLPPVFRAFIKEEVSKPESSKPVVTTGLTCYKGGITDSNHVTKETYIFTSEDYKLKKYSKKMEITYNDPLLYQTEKPKYGQLVTAFSIIDGYDYTATPNDDAATMIITEVYDLTKFQETMLAVLGEETPRNISAKYRIDRIQGSIKSDLESNGYTCS